jgi:hypothetical protein
MIGETEDFLGEHLNSSGPPTFPGHARSRGGDFHPYRNARDRRRGVYAVGRSANGTSGVGTLIPIPTDECGRVDREHLSALVYRLFSAARGSRRDDVLLDISGVRSATPTLLKVVDSFRRHLESQNRNVYLYDARQPKACLRNFSECEFLSFTSAAETDFESMALRRHTLGFERFAWCPGS